MPKFKPEEVMCIYRPKVGRANEFLKLLRRHYPTLRAAGLATARKAKAFRSVDQKGKTVFVETFAWKDAASPNVAHETPEVMALWEPMGQLCEEMTFLSVKQLPMPFDKK